ncbi:MAG: amino acid synthesis family protein [Actinomycetota bacterium]
MFDDMDAASFAIDDAPRPDEIVVALVYATGGRPAHRVQKVS